MNNVKDYSVLYNDAVRSVIMQWFAFYSHVDTLFYMTVSFH